MADEEPQADGARWPAWPLVAAVVAGGVAVAVVLARRRRPSTDLGAALLELVGEVGDVLSAYQDAVAGEAELRSRCRRRTVKLEFGDRGRGARRPARRLKLLATYGAGGGNEGNVAYLKVWDRRIIAVEDPDLATPACGGPDQAPGRGGLATQPASRPR